MYNSYTLVCITEKVASAEVDDSKNIITDMESGIDSGSGEAENQDVTPTPSVCEMVMDSGPCRALFYMWHYSFTDKR